MGEISGSDRFGSCDGREPIAGADVDWYGNTSLHHAFATHAVDISKVKQILEQHPHCASERNQFGRIPLHYALDRIKVNLEGLHILLRAYPEGVTVCDIDNQTPYDIARTWKHSAVIKRLLLQLAPSLDKNAYLRLTYGPLASIAIWASSVGKVDPNIHNRGTVYMDEDEEEGDGKEMEADLSDKHTEVVKFEAMSSGKEDKERRTGEGHPPPLPLLTSSVDSESSRFAAK